jgi:hypothetical protein
MATMENYSMKKNLFDDREFLAGFAAGTLITLGFEFYQNQVENMHIYFAIPGVLYSVFFLLAKMSVTRTMSVVLVVLSSLYLIFIQVLLYTQNERLIEIMQETGLNPMEYMFWGALLYLLWEHLRAI